MKKIRVAINGCGRIGRLALKLLFQNEKFELVAVNDLTDTATLLHLIQYDSIHGKFSKEVSLAENGFFIDGQFIRVFNERNPGNIPWGDIDVDFVLEATGRYTDLESATSHLQAGAKKVIITAPTPSLEIPTVVMGVNEQILTGSESIVSNASCTTNCLAPMVKLIDEHFGIIRGFVSTVHSYTNDQNLHDAPHRDLRRARAAAYSIIPTTTHAAKAMELVLPNLKGKIEASAMRVPVPDGSLTDLVVLVEQTCSASEINQIFMEAAQSSLKGILEYAEAPLVSIDIIGNPHSCIIDAGLTSSKGNLIKVVGWYDNEAGYANRLIDLILKIDSLSS